MADTLGSLIDKLTTVDLKMWNNQELIYDIRRMTLQEITFVGTYTYTSSDFKETADKIFNNEFGNLDWVDIRPLKDGQACFEEILEGKTLFPKIILKP